MTTITRRIINMNNQINIEVRPALDSEAIAQRNRQSLEMPRYTAAALGNETVAILQAGYYTGPSGERQSLQEALQKAIAAKVSIPPDTPLPQPALGWSGAPSEKLLLSVENATTLAVSRRLVAQGRRPLALNFAAPSHPGGGFLTGDRAQEENLARSSGLYATLIGDAMYDYHRSLHDGVFCPTHPKGIVGRSPALCGRKCGHGNQVFSGRRRKDRNHHAFCLFR